MLSIELKQKHTYCLADLRKFSNDAALMTYGTNVFMFS